MYKDNWILNIKRLFQGLPTSKKPPNFPKIGPYRDFLKIVLQKIRYLGIYLGISVSIPSFNRI